MRTIRFSSFTLAFAAACGSQSAVVGERIEEIDAPHDGGVHSQIDSVNADVEGSTVIPEDEDSSTATPTLDTGNPAPPTSNEVVPTSDGAQTVNDDSGSCEGFVYEAKANYDSWATAPNDWPVLAGTTFEGYVLGGPDVTLQINADQSATLLVGEAVPAPVADKGYLCEQRTLEVLTCDVRDLIPGGTYPLHGVTLDGSRLQAPIPTTSAFDEWCALQTPISWDDNCFYSVDSPMGYSFSDELCTVDEVEVDCAWMLLTKADVCACTWEECFATATLDTPGLDLRLSDDGMELTGDVLGSELYLSRTND